MSGTLGSFIDTQKVLWVKIEMGSIIDNTKSVWVKIEIHVGIFSLVKNPEAQ